MMDNDEDAKSVSVFQFQNRTLSSRCRDVFSSLDALEQKHQEFEQNRAREDAESDRHLIRQGPSTEETESVQPTFKRPTVAGRDYHESRKGGRHGQERVEQHEQFRKPMPPQTQYRGRNSSRGRYGRSRAMPDFRLHPERWTEYSLEDVDVSDTANKRAAFDFLHERRKMRENEAKEDPMDLETSACSKGQFTFQKPTKQALDTTQISGKEKSKALNNFEKMEDDNDQDELAEEDLNCTDDLENTNLKRKIENIDINDESDKVAVTEKSASFKSRKRIKRNFRSQREDDEHDNGE